MLWSRAEEIMMGFSVYNSGDVKFYTHSNMKSERFWAVFVVVFVVGFVCLPLFFSFLNCLLVEYKGNGQQAVARLSHFH